MQPAEQLEHKVQHHESFSVLIVDDDEAFRNTYVRALNLIQAVTVEAHMHALSAASPQEAMHMLETHKVDCCILDYKMPERNGLELQRDILTKYPDMAIIFVTGEGCEEVATEAIKHGAMDYIVKGTISIEQIESAIIHSVSRVRLTRALEMQNKHLMEAERQRVMLQSLGTTCHHMAQPLTALRTYIVMLKRRETDASQSAMLVEAFKSVEALCEIVWKIGRTSSYKTEPYLEPDHGHASDGDDDLIVL